MKIQVENINTGAFVDLFTPEGVRLLAENTKLEEGMFNHSYTGNREFSRPNAEFCVGYEIEKDDIITMRSISRRTFDKNYNPKGFFRTRDGSLNSLFGYEVVTKPIELDVKKVESVLTEDPFILEVVNAPITDRCGGHMTISHESKNAAELALEFKDFLPVLYTIYEQRVNNSYCQALNFPAYFTTSEKKTAIRIRDFGLEFRLFPGYKNLDDLLLKTKLIEAWARQKDKNKETSIDFWSSDIAKELLKTVGLAKNTAIRKHNNYYEKYIA